eukprot:scaffold34627_cov58-Skeletonema_marinoi.AAC.1
MIDDVTYQRDIDVDFHQQRTSSVQLYNLPFRADEEAAPDAAFTSWSRQEQSWTASDRAAGIGHDDDLCLRD